MPRPMPMAYRSSVRSSLFGPIFGALLGAGLVFSPIAGAVAIPPAEQQQIDPAWIELSPADHSFPVEQFLGFYERAEHYFVFQRQPNEGQNGNAPSWQLIQQTQAPACRKAICPEPDVQHLQTWLDTSPSALAKTTRGGDVGYALLFRRGDTQDLMVVDTTFLHAARQITDALAWMPVTPFRDWIRNPDSVPSALRSQTSNPALDSIRHALLFDQAMAGQRAPRLKTALRQGIAGIRHPALGYATCTAASTGWIKGLDVLLSHDPALVDTPCKAGLTPLALSQRFGHMRAIDLLVRRGARSLGSDDHSPAFPYATPDVFRHTVRAYMAGPERLRSAPPQAAVQSLQRFGPGDLKLTRRVRRDWPELFEQAFEHEPDSAARALQRAAELAQPDTFDYLLEQGLPESLRPADGPQLARWYRQRYDIPNRRSAPEQ